MIKSIFYSSLISIIVSSAYADLPYIDKCPKNHISFSIDSGTNKVNNETFLMNLDYDPANSTLTFNYDAPLFENTPTYTTHVTCNDGVLSAVNEIQNNLVFNIGLEIFKNVSQEWITDDSYSNNIKINVYDPKVINGELIFNYIVNK